MKLGENPGHHLPLAVKLRRIHWSFLLLLSAIAAIGAAMLYSAGNGSIEPWAVRHCARFAMGLTFLIAAALTDVRLWLRYAYAFYAVRWCCWRRWRSRARWAWGRSAGSTSASSSCSRRS